MKKFDKFINETKITNNPETKQKLDVFYSEYEELNFILVDLSDRLRRYDTIAGEYQSEDGDVSVTVKFFENEDGGWTIKADGENDITNDTLDVSFDYSNFEDVYDDLTKIFLNQKEGDNLDVFVVGEHFTIRPKDSDQDNGKEYEPFDYK